MNTLVSTDRVPDFFQILCGQAAEGAADGWWTAGHEFARHMGDTLTPSDVEDDVWSAELSRVFTDEATHEDLTRWFAATFPNHWNLVKVDGREEFISGVLALIEEDGLPV